VQDQKDQQIKKILEQEREIKLQKDIDRTERDRITKKGFKTLRNSGIYEAHGDLVKELCKHGLPKGNIYDFAAGHLLRCEKKMKLQKKKDLDQRLQIREKIKQDTMKSKSPRRGRKGSVKG
jgi:hypothetical protein